MAHRPRSQSLREWRTRSHRLRRHLPRPNFDADGHFNDNGGLAANYVVNDNQLTFNYTGSLEGLSETYDIEELTQSTLVYAANVTDTVNYRISFHHHRIK